MKNNAYFDEMYRIGCEWSKRNEAYKARKEEIIEKYGWDSDELKAWDNGSSLGAAYGVDYIRRISD